MLLWSLQEWGNSDVGTSYPKNKTLTVQGGPSGQIVGLGWLWLSSSIFWLGSCEIGRNPRAGRVGKIMEDPTSWPDGLRCTVLYLNKFSTFPWDEILMLGVLDSCADGRAQWLTMTWFGIGPRKQAHDVMVMYFASHAWNRVEIFVSSP